MNHDALISPGLRPLGKPAGYSVNQHKRLVGGIVDAMDSGCGSHLDEDGTVLRIANEMLS